MASTSVSTSNVHYPIQVQVWVDYGVKGRYIYGPFKDISNKYHEVSQVVDPNELTEYLRAPISFREFQAIAVWIMTVIFLSALLTVLYLVYIFTMIEEIEEGLAARDIYYVILAVLGVLGVIGFCYRHATLRKKITEYVDGLNRQIFLQKGLEMKMEYPWSIKGYRLTVTRHKEDPDIKNVSLMEEG